MLLLEHFRTRSFLRTLTAFALPLLFALPALANTLCVNQGSSHCFKTIGAAVAAASANDTITVAPGVYKEFVTITKPLSLIGENPATTVIDGTGNPNAIYINNTNQIVTGVVITGFTIENANYEGILVNGASAVTIWWNHVTNNDQLLEPSLRIRSARGLRRYTRLSRTSRMIAAKEFISQM